MDPTSTIITAVRTGNINDLKQYLAAGYPNLHEEHNAEGHTLLNIACDNGRVECAEALIAAGADVNAKDYNCRSSLHLSCHRGSAECAKLLIKAGADINAIDDTRWTPLYIASLRGQLECTNVLIDAGADHAICDDFVGDSPLHIACEYGSTKCAEVLIRAGADINMQNKNKCTPLHYACEQNRIDIVRTLLECGADASIRTYSESSRIMTIRSSNIIEGVSRHIITHEGKLPSDLTNDPDIKTLLDEYSGGKSLKAVVI